MSRTSSSSPDPARIAAVKGKIKRASQLQQPVRVLIYGRSGAGKTRLAASAPNVLLVDVNERGTVSTKRDYDPHVFPVETWTEIQDVYWYLAAGDHPFETVAIDSVTAMQNFCLKFVMGDDAARDASRDPDMPTRQAWGKTSELMKTVITNFRNLPMHVVFTALTRVTTVGDSDDGDMGDSITGPAASPSIAGHLEAAVDLVGYLAVREVVTKGESGARKKVRRRQLEVGPSDRYLTKDRYGIFGNAVAKPNLAVMFQQAQEGVTEDA